MCGIVGLVDFKNLVVQSEIDSLRDSLAHRGPDAAGTYVHANGHIGLGHRRLSVIDLSNSGNQPLSNEDGTVWIVFNGEIYNFKLLHEELCQKGHLFTSNSDTEVIVHAYEEWGDDFIKRLAGMFAFALLDLRGAEARILLVRDRLGVKPLYYLLQHQQSRLIFASEAHSLYKYASIDYDSINRSALEFYLAFGWIPPDQTIVSGISKLPPATILGFTSNSLQMWKYWQVPSTIAATLADTSYTLSTIDTLLHQAVERRLISDVPLGSFLSGGIDSGLVTAIAAIQSREPLRTFSVGFDDVNDERPIAKMVAKRYGTKHTELLVQNDVASALPQLIWNCAEPFADFSILPTYAISQAARQHITVALTGDGGDESFAGYLNIRAAYHSGKLRRMISPLLLKFLWEVTQRFRNQFVPIRRLHTLLTYAHVPVRDLYDLSTLWHRSLRHSLIEPTWNKDDAVNDPLKYVDKLLAQASNLPRVEQQLFIDLHMRLPGDYLPKVDIASSAVALEIRSPFLDHELVEFAAGLPIHIRMTNGMQKGLLRQLALKYLPEELIRQPKRGFGTDVSQWFKQQWSPLIEQMVVNGIAKRSNIFAPNTVLRIVQEHRQGKYNHSQRIWTLICLEVWLRLFVDKSLDPQDKLI